MDLEERKSLIEDLKIIEDLTFEIVDHIASMHAAMIQEAVIETAHDRRHS